jgi:tRNA (guanine10-N2)-dimethyltransferase
MRFLLELSKENLDLSNQEVVNLAKCKHPYSFSNFLLIDSDAKEIDFLAKRLAYTKRIYKVLFLCMEKNLVSNLNKFDWHNVYSKNFSVRLNYNSKMSEKDLAGIVWNNLKKPKVNLRNSNTNIHFFKLRGRIFCTLLEKEVKQDYLSRKAHKRPELHPSSLNPRLAKALINLTGIKKGSIVDPMCGSGGIMIEAGLMELKPIGYDIDEVMINRARINLDYFGLKEYTLKLNRKIKYVVSDLPYGKNTKQKELKELYGEFFSRLRVILIERAVICLPVFREKRNINYISLMKKNGFKIKNNFSYYVHKSLSRVIFVLE